MHKIISTIKQLAEQNPDILIVWLYGSRAKGNAHRLSDYDLAVAFKSVIKNDPSEKLVASGMSGTGLAAGISVPHIRGDEPKHCVSLAA
jgi:predicted nucleotidyltransferase